MKKNSAFKSRLFFAYSLLIALSVCAFLGALAFVIAQTGENEARANQKETLLSELRQLESSMRELDTLASRAMENEQLISFFVPLMGDSGDENYFDANVLEFIDASSLLATLNGARGTAARVSAYNLGGDYVSAGTLYETPERIRQSLSDKAAIRAQLDALQENNDRRVILPPSADPFSSSKTNRLFQILRPLSSTYGPIVYGIVSVQQDVRQLEALDLFHQSEDGACFLMDANGEIILPEEPGALVRAARDAAVSMPGPASGEAASADVQTPAGTLFVSIARMDLSGWLVVRAQPKAHLLHAYRPALLALGLSGVLLMAVLLGAAYYLADRITRPLKRLSESFEQVTLVDMAPPAPLPEGERSTSELVALDNAFRMMLSRLNDSIGLEMRAYLYALQSQMNPHFLYNTLSVICATGEEEGAEKTVSMCLMLSEMLRYIASYDKDSVLMKDEIDHAMRYLQLMKVRYEANFDYELHVEPGAEQIRVPKLILQPLAENCFQHAFKDVRPPWTIRITVQMQGDWFLMTVADNGSGMSEEQIERLKARIEESSRDLAGNYPQLRIGGMGLINTVLRLKLLSGDVSYQILSSAQGGAIIQIGGKIP